MNILRKAWGAVLRPWRLSDDYIPRGGLISHAGESVSEDGALALSTVWACVNLLAGTIAAMPLDLQRRGAGGAPVADDAHPLARVLRDSPNADQTPMDFWEYMCLSLELRGNAYARIERMGDRIVALEPVPPGAVSVRRRATGELEYRWSEDGKSYVCLAREMFHVRGFGGHPLGGLSTLAHGRNTFGLAAAIDRTAGSYFRNGLHAAVAIKFEKFLTKEQRDIVDAEMAAKYIGAQNAGKPFRLEGGADVEKIGIDPEDAQMLESRAFSVEDICRIFGVPPHMVGHTSKTTSWGAGLEQQVLGFQKFTLRRRLKKIEQAIRKQLLSAADRAAGLSVSFNLEALLRADSLARASYYSSLLASGVMTINEVRALEGLPPVAGGDVPRMQIQNVPITEARVPEELRGHNGGPPLDDEDEAA